MIMKNRFYIKENNIFDSRTNKAIGIDTIVDLLNNFEKSSCLCLNEISRLEDGLVDLDILIGTLSWYIDEDSLYGLNDVRSVSSKLSECITDVMYPKVEEGHKR